MTSWRDWRAAVPAVLGLLSIASAACGGDDDSSTTRPPPGQCTYTIDAGADASPEAGVVMGCPDRFVCQTTTLAPRCICDEPFQGVDCSACARGWTETTVDGETVCEPVPIDCNRRPEVCEPGGECKTVNEVHFCDCDPGYDGRVCSRCAFGFQDNDLDGTCEPDCRSSGLRCPGRRMCSDESGEAQCVCISGYTGESCDTCAAGYRATGTGGCLATCDVADLDCGIHGACSDLDGAPHCVCDVGYGGAGCAACAPTHHDDGMGVCVGDPPPGYTFLATASGERGEPVLGALDPIDGDFVGLAMLARPVGPIAYDAAGDRVFGVSSGRLVTLDRHYGTVTDVVPFVDTIQAGIAYDSTRGVIWAAISGGQLVQIDPASGNVTTIDGTSGRWWDSSLSFTYDATNDAVLAASGTTARYVVDAATGSTESLSGLFVGHDVERLAIAIDPVTGAPQAIADSVPSPTDLLHAFCRELSAALRYPIPDSVALGEYGPVIDPMDPLAPIVLEYDGRNPPLVAYGSYGSRSSPPRTVRVRTSHPDAVVCIVTYEEPLHVVVEAGAQFHYLLMVSYEPGLSLEVMDGFVPKLEGVPPIRVRVNDTPLDPSLFAEPDLVHVYESDEWYALGVTTDIWSSYGAPRDPIILAIDWETGAVFERAAAVRSFAGGLAAFRGMP